MVSRFDYEDAISTAQLNEQGISTENLEAEHVGIMSGVIRQQDPKVAFNVIPTPLLDSVAAITLASLYNANPCWDFISGKICLYEKKLLRF